MNKARVLVVDDEELICKNIVSKISRLNHKCDYEVYTVTCLVSALEQYERLRPEIIITDICMPNGSGLTLVEKIRKKDKDVIILILSGYNDFSYVRKAFILGVDDYLLKPLSLQELDEKLSSKIEKIISKYLLEEQVKTKDNRTMMQIVNQYIVENLSHVIQMKDVADKVNLSYHYFSKMFKDNAGMSFSKYVLERKMLVAKELVQDHTVRVNEIAYKLGFKESNHFSRAFKKANGLYPTAYRELYVNKKQENNIANKI